MKTSTFTSYVTPDEPSPARDLEIALRQTNFSERYELRTVDGQLQVVLKRGEAITEVLTKLEAIDFAKWIFVIYNQPDYKAPLTQNPLTFWQSVRHFFKGGRFVALP